MPTSLPQFTRVVAVEEESARIRTFTLKVEMEADPGQFIMAWLPGVDEKPFSLVEARPVTLTIARVGPFTEAIHRLGPGDALWLRGPLGRGFELPPSRVKGAKSGILLVAGGYGVAPLYFLTGRALAADWAVDVVVGAKTAGDVVFAGRLAALGARVTVTTDDGSLGQKGLATEAAARLLDEGAYCCVYACGPDPMLEGVAGLARSYRLPAQLSYERYMRCGFGVCGSCARDGWLVCRDGPVKSVCP